ncbi:MAG TPA: poly-gamma-glutamate biosynthesis protein PgsC [Actinomycetota bacterium]
MPEFSVVLGLGVGLSASLALAEILSIAPGGYIVPGYLALSLDHPARVLATVGVALVTLVVLKVVGQFLILYGMRRFVLYLLVGFALGTAYATLVAEHAHTPIQAVGFLVPGLIASWMDRQGVLVTLGSMITVAIIARLVLLLFARL